MRSNLKLLKDSKKRDSKKVKKEKAKPVKTNGASRHGKGHPSPQRRKSISVIPKKRQSVSSDEEEIITEVTFDMKRELATKISSFEGQDLAHAIDIIRASDPLLLGVRGVQSASCPEC